MPCTNTKGSGLESLIVKWLATQNVYEEGINLQDSKMRKRSIQERYKYDK